MTARHSRRFQTGELCRRAVLIDHIDRLVVEAKRLGFELSELLDAVRKEWK